MKKAISSVSVILSIVIGAFFIFQSMAFAKPFKLRYWTHDSPNSYRVKEIYNVYAQRVEKATNGQVKISIDAMSPITNPRNAHDAVAAGVVDIAMCMTGVSPGRYPMLDSVVLPGLGYQSSEMASIGLAKLVEHFPAIEKRMGNVKIIGLCATGMDIVGTSKKPVRNVNDLKGLKLRSAGKFAQKLLKDMGAIPIMMGPGDIYSNIQKGVIGGFNMPFGGVSIFKLHEVTKYATLTHNWTGTFFTLINLDKWNSFSKEIQNQINSVSGPEWSRYIGQVTDANEARSRKLALDKGMEIIKPSPEFRAEMLKCSKKIWKEYVETLAKKGLPGQELLDFNHDFIKNYSD